MTLTIRSVAQDDYAQWHRLWTAYLEFYDSTLPEETKKIAFSRLLAQDTKVHGKIAVSDGEAVGLVHFIYHDHMWHPEGVCYLQDLYADPAKRGTGIGRKLIESVYDAATAAGGPSVYWMTQDFNQTARQLYDRIGTVTPFIKYQRK